MPQSATPQKREFENAIKVIRQCVSGKNRSLPKDENKLREYAERLVNAYNKFVGNIAAKYPGFNRTKQAVADDKFDRSHKPNLIKFLGIVGYEIEQPAGFNLIDTDSLKKLSAESTLNSTDIDLNVSFTGSISDLSSSDSEENQGSPTKILSQSTVNDTQLPSTSNTNAQKSKNSDNSSVEKDISNENLISDASNLQNISVNDVISKNLTDLETSLSSKISDSVGNDSDENQKGQTAPKSTINGDANLIQLEQSDNSESDNTDPIPKNPLGQNSPLEPKDPNKANKTSSASNQTAKMTTKIEFHNLCARTFNENYEGDPKGLDSFLNKIESIEILCENDDHKKILIRNVVAHVTQRALDVTNNCGRS